MKKNAPKKAIPFDFVLSEIESLMPYTKPMFGAHGVYIDDKIVFILRDRDSSPEDNGVWIATTEEHHKSLKKDLPIMRSIAVFGPGPTGWQVLPSESDDFEDCVIKACAFVLRKDPRIGKIPKTKLKKKNKPKRR